VAIAKITRTGLAAMAVSVALLWGCLISERYVVQRAGLVRARALYNLERLREGHQPQPVSAPGRVLPGHFTAIALG
jgi:hypothetical protein